jgi:ADP-heptose:LPS heptosyltransferase
VYTKLGIIISGEIENAMLILPIITQLKNEQNKIELIIIYEKIEHYHILENTSEIDQFLNIRGIKAFTIFSQGDKVFNPFINLNSAKHALHIMDQIALNLNCNWFCKDNHQKIVLPEEETAIKFISKYKLPAVIQVSSNLINGWDYDKWEMVVKKFPEVTFIQIGKSNDKYIVGAIDLRGKTSVRGSLALIKHSKFCIGDDSFINHASFLTKKKGIILFGPTKPTINGYEHNVNLYKYAACSPCNNHDKCEVEKSCLSTITVDEVSNCVSDILSNRLSNKIALITMAGLGDMIMTTPIIRALKEKYPNHHLTIFYNGTKKNHEILENNPFVDEMIDLNRLSNNRKFIRDCNDYKFIYEPYYYFYANLKLIEYMFRQCNLKYLPKYKLDIFLTEDEEKKAKDLIRRYKNPICIQTESFYNIKNWDLEKWAQLINRNRRYTFLHLGALIEKPIEGTVDLRGRTSIREAIAIIKHSKLFIGIDSFMAHACIAVKTKGIILFGPTPVEYIGHPDNVNINLNICSPSCNELSFDSFNCKLNKKCMNDIQIQDIETEIDNHMKIND